VRRLQGPRTQSGAGQGGGLASLVRRARKKWGGDGRVEGAGQDRVLLRAQGLEGLALAAVAVGGYGPHTAPGLAGKFVA
jgi:hypothetical protein